MKFHFTLIISLLILNAALGQDSGKLFLEGNKLKGSCKNQYFTGFEIELDATYTTIDSFSLFEQLPRIGKINFKNRVDIPTEFTTTKRAGYPQIMFRFKTSYHTFDQLEIADQFISFKVDDDPNVPITENDLKIIRLTKSLLSNEQNWNKEDDRACDDDLINGSYSIYCAVRIASLQIENRYNHRNAVLQKLRHIIDEKYPNKKWNHRLMDFNNMESLAFNEVINILTEIESDVVQQLEDKDKK